MQIASLSMSMSQTNVLRDVNFALMRNAMDHMEQTGDLVSQLMQSMPLDVPPVGFDGMGANLDVFI